LAGLVQAPSEYDPVTHPALARERQIAVLRSLVRTGDLTETEAARALARPLRLRDGRDDCPLVCPWNRFAQSSGGRLVRSASIGRRARRWRGALVLRRLRFEGVARLWMAARSRPPRSSRAQRLVRSFRSV
jgi:membrane peptidoglycan carboxypeptidase